MSEHVEYVKAAAAFLKENCERSRAAGNEAAADRLERHHTHLIMVSEELARLLYLTKALPPDLGSIHDLPPELLEELSVAKTDELEDQIVTVINSYGTEASLDQILVGLFRKFNVLQKRRFLQNKLYRMSMVWSVDGRKGVYTTTEPDESDVKAPENSPTTDGPPPWEDDQEIPF